MESRYEDMAQMAIRKPMWIQGMTMERVTPTLMTGVGHLAGPADSLRPGAGAAPETRGSKPYVNFNQERWHNDSSQR